MRLKLFLTSFLILFLELSLIRFLPSQVYYLGYYTNFILIAGFVGIGGGILLSKKRGDYCRYFPWALLILLAISIYLVVSIVPDQNGELHITSSYTANRFPETVAVPLIFILVVFTFIFLSVRLGKLINTFTPLTFYFLDILGSLSGIAVFTLLTYIRFPPPVWFGTVFAVYSFITFKKNSRWVMENIVLLSAVVIIVQSSAGSYWSAYQKISLTPWYKDGDISKGEIGQAVMVNNILHQITMYNPRDITSIYLSPYVLFKHPSYKNVLIIGAGTGNDAVLALNQKAQHIDAVEIDPVIYEIGKKNNPNRPYNDPRVNIYIDDGRSFLSKSRDKYDLIIFALTDSLVLASPNSTIRLESFLFTRESIEAAKEHLTGDGILVLYNVYRKEAVMSKLTSIADSIFGKPSFVGYEENEYRGVIINGGKLADLKDPLPLNKLIKEKDVPTDDWPFLYLTKRAIPFPYLEMLFLIGVFTYFLLSYIIKKPLYRIIAPEYFFLGTAFLLVETKSLIQFSLLFGNTWLVNAFVFFALLTLVLISVFIAAKAAIKRAEILYIALFLSLLIQYFFPVEKLLAYSPVIKYTAVSIVTLVPVFFANLIFSVTFKKSKDNAGNFASNILGAAVGGGLEYTALITGYRQLTLLVIACYILALIAPRMRIKNVT